MAPHREFNRELTQFVSDSIPSCSYFRSSFLLLLISEVCPKPQLINFLTTSTFCHKKKKVFFFSSFFLLSFYCCFRSWTSLFNSLNVLFRFFFFFETTRARKKVKRRRKCWFSDLCDEIKDVILFFACLVANAVDVDVAAAAAAEKI